MTIEELNKLSEIETYMFIDYCGAFIWRMSHNGITNEDVKNVGYDQKLAVSTLSRFGVIVNEDLTPTPDYWKWFEWWNNYIKKTLSSEQYYELSNLIDSKSDFSMFKPSGSWKD